MKIEILIRRKAGSTVVLDDETYAWNDANGHVCEVNNAEHAKRLLSFPHFVKADPAGKVVSDPGANAPEVKADKAPRKPRQAKVKA